MARGRWLRDPLTGLSAEVDVNLSEARSLGCNLFDVTSIAPHFDITKVRYFRDVVAPRAQALGVHLVELRDLRNDSLVGYATRINSAERAGEMWQAYRKGRLDGTITNVSGGDQVARLRVLR